MVDNRTILEIHTDGTRAAGGDDKTLALLIVWTLLVGSALTGSYLYVKWLSSRSLPPTVQPEPDVASYSARIWTEPQTKDIFYQKGGALPAVFYLWDSCPQEILDQFPAAANLQEHWPPLQGERFRLVAYPFGSKSSGILAWDVIKGIFEMVNTYKDQATFPGWFVSVYDADRLFSTQGNPYAPTDSNVLRPLRCNQMVFNSFFWTEVIRACYAIPGHGYPACDDGGHWYYHSPGSGIWYNVGNCLVRYNKLDALTLLMAQLGWVFNNNEKASGEWPQLQKLKLEESASALYQELLYNADDVDLHAYNTAKGAEDCWKVAKAQLVAAMKKVQGDVDIFQYIRQIMTTRGRGEQVVDGVLFFREFSQSDDARSTHIIQETAALTAGVLACATAGILSLLFWVAGKTSALLVLATFGAVVAGGAWFWFKQLTRVLAGLGVTTLAGALRSHALTAETALDCVVEPSEDVPLQTRKALSGMPMTQVFDLAIETFGALLGYDVVIMHTQPNKSGTFTVEMVDLTHFSKDAPWAGGLCGLAAGGSMCNVPTVMPRGGLCWPEGAGSSVKPLQSVPPSVYQRMSFSAVNMNQTKIPLPSVDASPATQMNYTEYTNNLFVTAKAQACTCVELNSANVVLKCLNCKDSTSGDLCT